MMIKVLPRRLTEPQSRALAFLPPDGSWTTENVGRLAAAAEGVPLEFH